MHAVFLESQPALRTLWLVTVLCVQSQALATSVAVCGSCTWSVEAGLLQKDGECQDDCFGRLEMDNKGISSISSGSFSGLPLLQELSLGNNELVTLPEGLFQALPQLRYLSLRRNPLVGLPNGTFASTFKLRTLFVDHTGIGCVPADRIPDDASIEVGKKSCNRRTTPALSTVLITLLGRVPFAARQTARSARYTMLQRTT